jgi:hypothetical protein
MTKLTPIAEAVAWSRLRGLRTSESMGKAIRSAWGPSWRKPITPPVPQTSAPSHSAGPCSTAPEKSRPGTRGSSVCSIDPATFLTSLGLTEAALMRMTAVASYGRGSRKVTGCSFDGSPNTVNWIARMAWVPSEIESRPDADPVDVLRTRRFQEAVDGQCPTFALMICIGSMGGSYIELYSIVVSSTESTAKRRGDPLDPKRPSAEQISRASECYDRAECKMQ